MEKSGEGRRCGGSRESGAGRRGGIEGRGLTEAEEEMERKGGGRAEESGGRVEGERR